MPLEEFLTIPVVTRDRMCRERILGYNWRSEEDFVGHWQQDDYCVFSTIMREWTGMQQCDFRDALTRIWRMRHSANSAGKRSLRPMGVTMYEPGDYRDAGLFVILQEEDAARREGEGCCD